jgi:hypothetical protein
MREAVLLESAGTRRTDAPPAHQPSANGHQVPLPRRITDIASFSAALLGSDAGGDHRGQSLEYLMANFRPGGTIDIARQTAAG